MASQITSLTIVYSTVYSGADQRKHQSSASLAFVRGIHRLPVNSPHKWPVTRKMFPLDDVIICPLRWSPPGMHRKVFVVIMVVIADALMTNRRCKHHPNLITTVNTKLDHHPNWISVPVNKYYATCTRYSRYKTLLKIGRDVGNRLVSVLFIGSFRQSMQYILDRDSHILSCSDHYCISDLQTNLFVGHTTTQRLCNLRHMLHSISHASCTLFEYCAFCCGMVLTISIRNTSQTLGQSHDCPSDCEEYLMDMG